MNFLFDQASKVLNAAGPAPKIPPRTRNRVDADPSLIIYHESGTGPMPSPQPTNVLPCRTRLVTNPFTEIAKAQSEAYYEEIVTIPAATLNLKSEFSAGHWYVVHPVTYWQVRDFGNRVLKDLEEWLEVKCPNEMFTRKAKQVTAFKCARNESLEEVKKELARREKRGKVGDEEGYTGDWEVLPDESEMRKSQEDNSEEAEATKGYGEGGPVSCHTKAALEEAAEAGRKAAEEAKILDEWEVDL